jgi:hypothetical protein
MWDRTDPRWKRYADDDFVLEAMLKHGLPLTRASYVAANWGPSSDLPSPWTAEHEAEIPEPLQDWSRVEGPRYDDEPAPARAGLTLTAVPGDPFAGMQ